MLYAINSLIEYLGGETIYLQKNKENDEVSVCNSQNISVKSAKCHLCIMNLRVISNKERRRHKSDLNKINRSMCYAKINLAKTFNNKHY